MRFLREFWLKVGHFWEKVRDVWENFEAKEIYESILRERIDFWWRRKWQPTPVFLPGESHGQSNLVGYSPQGRKVGYSGVTILYWFLKQRKTLMIFWGEEWKFLVKRRFLRELFRKEGDFWRNSEEKEVSLRVTERRVRGIWANVGERSSVWGRVWGNFEEMRLTGNSERKVMFLLLFFILVICAFISLSILAESLSILLTFYLVLLIIVFPFSISFISVLYYFPPSMQYCSL